MTDDDIMRMQYELHRLQQRVADLERDITLARREAEAARLRASEADGLYVGLLRGTR